MNEKQGLVDRHRFFEELRQAASTSKTSWSEQSLAGVSMYQSCHHVTAVIQRTPSSSPAPADNHFEDVLDMVNGPDLTISRTSSKWSACRLKKGLGI
ncbi:hypothetical protein [Dyella nitratireducens]|uniref:hypothetical protein n=1 Tax=Dyella nitratireducens TaxID=1849580 RepID=UPI00166D9061|nr:hypothetical protein [Dyella nitratireducens]